MKVYPVRAWFGALSCSVLLTACGGGSSGASSHQESGEKTVITMTAGYYQGKVSNGNEYRAYVLEDGRIYTFYAAPDPAIPGEHMMAGFLSGKIESAFLSPTESSFTAAVKNFPLAGSSSAATLSANYKPGHGFDGKLAATDGTLLLTFTADTAHDAGYDFNARAVVADIAGDWQMDDIQAGQKNTLEAALKIQADGTLTGLLKNGCSVSGTVAPHAEKNLFTLELAFAGDTGTCAMSGQTASGVAISAKEPDGARSLIMLSVDQTQSQGWMLAGDRP